MEKSKLLEHLGNRILKIQKDFPVLIAIDGVDASGKTSLAKELVKVLQQNTKREIIYSSIDGFHNPQNIRYQKGRGSPEGYYLDSFNYELLKKYLLNPLSLGGKRAYQTKTFDYKIDKEVLEKPKIAQDNSILIIDGVFLQREEVKAYWDIVIFLDIDFQTTLLRAIQRDGGDKELVAKRYKERYIPGQEIYFQKAKPKESADIIIDNTDFHAPQIIKE